ncbi:MAG: IS630 family transposase [Nitrososphaerales archaeon]
MGGGQGGVPPRWQPRISGRHVRQARLTARQRNAPHGQVQRARLALLLYRRPSMTSPEAARRLGQSAGWAYHWRRVWAAEGFRLDDVPRSGRPRVYSATDQAVVIAVACELPSQRDLPLSRHFASSIREVVRTEGIPMSLRTVQRILAENTLKPWRYRSWIHPRDPHFRTKAEVILGLYEGVWEGRRLGAGDAIVSADEKPSIQARRHLVVPPAPGRAGLVESDYQRCGAVQYLCAWDVRRGIPWGRCEAKNGIAAFDRLVDEVMAKEPYRSAHRVFWIVDNGSAHRGPKAAARLARRHPTLILVHTPVHASWLNQVEIHFGVLQRKILTPAAAHDLPQLTHRILTFEARARDHPRPVRWKFTRADFRRRCAELAA